MRYFSKRLIGGMALICCIAFTIVACSNTTSSGSTTTGGTPTATAPAANAILTSAEQAPLKDATFDFTLSGNGGTTPTVNTSGSGRLTTHPARSDLTFPAIQFQGVSTSAEVIIDQATTTYYLKTAALSQWVKLNPTSLGLDLGVVSITDYSGLQNVTLVGAETISGTPTWHIRGTKTQTNSGSVGSGTVVRTEDLWFRQSDYYPVKIAIVDNANASSSGPATPAPTPSPTVSAQATLNETFTFTKWDSGFTIDLPTNVVGGSVS
jgi:hypothetical protein